MGTLKKRKSESSWMHSRKEFDLLIMYKEGSLENRKFQMTTYLEGRKGVTINWPKVEVARATKVTQVINGIERVVMYRTQCGAAFSPPENLIKKIRESKIRNKR